MKKFFPTPREVKDGGALVKIGVLSRADFTLSASAEGEMISAAIAFITDEFNNKCAILPPFEGKYAISLSVNPADSRIADKGEEAYVVTVSDKSAELICASERSAYYAAVTLMEIVELKGAAVYLPICEIVDYPRFTKRGVLVESRYNDFMTLDDWKSAIDDFAKLKLNKLEVAVYGSWSKQYDNQKSEQQYIPFESIPDFRNPKPRKFYSVKKGRWVNIPNTLPEMYEKDFFGDVIKYGKAKNVEVFPLFNSFGHNTLLPTVCPELSALDADGNPTKSGFCTSNEKVYETLFKLYDEIIDRYLAPNGITSFSVGLDEVSDAAFCKCPKCAGKTKPEIFTEHAIRLVKYLKERGMKEVYVYDDMYLYIFDNLDEALAQKFKDAGVYDVTVMDWWNYGARVDFFRGKADKLNRVFEKSIIRPMSGYWHWQGWSDNTLNIAYCAAKANELNYDGMISYSTYEPALDYNYSFLAEASWNPITDAENSIFDFSEKYFERNYPLHSREAEQSWQIIRHRLHPYNYDENPPATSEFAQYVYSYFKPDMAFPRNHIAEIMNKIEANEYRYLTYIHDLLGRSSRALEFFGSDKAKTSPVNENFVATINEQYSYANEMFVLYNMYKDSKAGKLTNTEMIAKVKALIEARMNQMLLVENSRLESIRHQTLRMMTINLEYLWELLANIESADAKGELFVYDPESAVDRNEPVFKFLR